MRTGRDPVVAFDCLSGAWNGVYRYPGGVLPETVFVAVLSETDGMLSGTTLEPDVLGVNNGAGVRASLDGARTGSAVRFVKFMAPGSGMRHTIRYEGEVNAALTEIVGRWLIPGDWSGDFVMTRDEDEPAAAVVRAEEVVG